MKKLSLFVISALACAGANAMDMSDPNPTIDIKLLRSMDQTQTDCVVSHGCKIPTDADVAYWNETKSNPRPEDIRTRQCLKGAMRDCGVGTPLPDKSMGVMAMPDAGPMMDRPEFGIDAEGELDSGMGIFE